MAACANMKQASECTRVAVDFADAKEAPTRWHGYFPRGIASLQPSLLRVPVSPAHPGLSYG